MISAKSLSIAALGLLFSQCASGPALDRRITVVAGQATEVAYENLDAAQSQRTKSQSSLTQSEAEAERAKDTGLKIIPDADMQLLADRLGGEGFFDLAESYRNPRAKSWIVVRHGGKDYFMTNVRRSNDEVFQFSQCIQAFFDIYNVNYNFVGSRMNAADFKREGQAVNSTSRNVRVEKQRKNQHP